VQVAEKHLRIDVEVRIRRGRFPRKREQRAPGEENPLPDPDRYERFVRAESVILSECLEELGSNDPFEIANAITALEIATDTIMLTGAHASVLNRFDAYMTMLQKAKGDRADILQMALWHRDLCDRSANLAALPDTPSVAQGLDAFIAHHHTGTAELSAYASLLDGISPALRRIAAGLGASAQLDPLIAQLSTATGARALQKAHRTFLLALQQVA
jgi:hypothetical protein